MEQRVSNSGIVTSIGLVVIGIVGLSVQTVSGQQPTVVEVVASEYAFTSLPDEVPVGTTLVLRNDGAEFHEMMVARVADETTETLEELLVLGEDAVESGLVELVSDDVFVEPGAVSADTIVLDREGRYVLICDLPQGLEADLVARLGVTEDMDPSEWPPELHAIFEHPTHAAAGMVKELIVVAADVPEPQAGHPPHERVAHGPTS